MYVVNGGGAELRHGGGAVAAAIDLTALRQGENSHALASLLYNVHSRSCVYFRQVVKISMFYDTYYYIPEESRASTDNCCE